MNIKFSEKRKKNGHGIEIDGWFVTESSLGPSRKMMKLSPWIESDNFKEQELDFQDEKKTPKLPNSVTDPAVIKNFKQNFAGNNKFKTANVKLLNEPFQVGIVENFLSDKSIIPHLIAEMESVEWTRKQMDLYEFYQTTDLANVQSCHLAKFYNFLNTDVREWMQQLTGMKFQKISASCSMYNCGDFLLTHDDLLSDRLIAFVFYLSPWDGKEKWSEAMGGALELFTMDVDGQPKFPPAKKIFSANNQFVFFKVEKKSYHQVGEVLTKDYPRLTINGWFHGFEDNADFDADATKVKILNVPAFVPPTDATGKLETFISKTYLKDSVKTSIQKQIEEDSEAALGDFLDSKLHAKLNEELNSKTLRWTIKGPSNQQNYESLDVNSLRKNSNIETLLELMKSKAMFKLLHEYTELDLHGPKARKPKCSIEVQRWKGGCYTLIGDPSTYNNDTLDLILYFGSSDTAGVITYLTPEEDNAEADDEPVLLTVYPQNNFLNIVYRSEGTAKFTKYCPKSSVMKSKFNYILFCSYKE